MKLHDFIPLLFLLAFFTAQGFILIEYALALVWFRLPDFFDSVSELADFLFVDTVDVEFSRRDNFDA
jgi:hypothetical protein